MVGGEAELALLEGLDELHPTVSRDEPSGDHGDLPPKSSNTEVAPSKRELSDVPFD